MNKAELVNIKFAPIYDNGSSLGRDIHESKIQNFLNNESKIQKYIDKGESEIRWTANNEKINHFDIIKKVKEKYNQQVTNTINNVINKYKKEDIERIIIQIDTKVPESIKETKLSLQRKKLIIKFVDCRIERLKEVIE